MKESNDLMKRRKDKARRTRVEETRKMKQEEEGSSKTETVTFISGPTVCFPNTGFGDCSKGRKWDRTH